MAFFKRKTVPADSEKFIFSWRVRMQNRNFSHSWLLMKCSRPPKNTGCLLRDGPGSSQTKFTRRFLNSYCEISRPLWWIKQATCNIGPKRKHEKAGGKKVPTTDRNLQKPNDEGNGCPADSGSISCPLFLTRQRCQK